MLITVNFPVEYECIKLRSMFSSNYKCFLVKHTNKNNFDVFNFSLFKNEVRLRVYFITT